MAGYFGGTVVPVVLAASLAALRATDPTHLQESAMAAVTSFQEVTADGYSFYRWDAADTSADNGFSIIKPDSIGGGSPGRYLGFGVRAPSFTTSAGGTNTILLAAVGTTGFFTVGGTITSMTMTQTVHASAAGNPWTIRAQRGFAGFVGGDLTVGGGDGGTLGVNRAGHTIIQLGQEDATSSATLRVMRGATSVFDLYYAVAGGYSRIDSTAGGGIYIQSTTGIAWMRGQSQAGLESAAGGNMWLDAGVLNLGVGTATVLASLASFTLSQAQDASAAGGVFTIRAQQGFAGFVGGILSLGGGDGGTPGTNLAGETRINLGTLVATNSTKCAFYASGAEKGFIRAEATNDFAINAPVGSLLLTGAGNLFAQAVSVIFRSSTGTYFDSSLNVFRDAGFVQRMYINVAAAMNIDFDASVSGVQFTWAQDGSAAGGMLSIRGQRGFAGFAGGDVIIAGGLGGTAGTNSGGAVRIKLGVPVAGATAPFQLEREDGTAILTAYEIGGSSVAIYFGSPGGDMIGTVRGSAVNVESATTTVALTPATDLYIGHAAGRDIFHREGGTVVINERLDADATTSFTLASTVLAFLLQFAVTASANGGNITIQAQETSHASGQGGSTAIVGGAGKTGGTAFLSGGGGVGTDASGGHAFVMGGSKTGTGLVGNVALHAGPASWNGSSKNIFVGDVAVAPTGNPAAGTYVWSATGQLRSRSPNGIQQGISFEDTVSGGQQKSYDPFVITDTDYDTTDTLLYTYANADIPDNSILYLYAKIMLRRHTGGTDTIILHRHTVVSKSSGTTAIDTAYDIETEQAAFPNGAAYATIVNSCLWQRNGGTNAIELALSTKLDNFHVTAWIERNIVRP